MPAKCLFALGVGHVRRRTIEPGAKSDDLADATPVEVAELSEHEWRVAHRPQARVRARGDRRDLWERARATRPAFRSTSSSTWRRPSTGASIIGRFSTFLEHVKSVDGRTPVTRYNALFHWAVPAGREIEAGREVGRHHILTHGYWREAGPEFNNVNVMAVAHGTDKSLLLEHKAAIDAHLASIGIPVSYTNVFWGGRSEIKPSEISPIAYRDWCAEMGLAHDS